MLICNDEVLDKAEEAFYKNTETSSKAHETAESCVSHNSSKFYMHL